MQLMDVPAGEYLVFEHRPFDFETQNAAVEAKVEQVMRDFDYAASGWQLDLTPGRVFYFYHDCARFFKYVRPVGPETTEKPGALPSGSAPAITCVCCYVNQI